MNKREKSAGSSTKVFENFFLNFHDSSNRYFCVTLINNIQHSTLVEWNYRKKSRKICLEKIGQKELSSEVIATLWNEFGFDWNEKLRFEGGRGILIEISVMGKILFVEWGKSWE